MTLLSGHSGHRAKSHDVPVYALHVGDARLKALLNTGPCVVFGNGDPPSCYSPVELVHSETHR